MNLARLCLINFHHMIELYDSYKINLIFVSSVKESQLCIFTFDLPSKKKQKKKKKKSAKSLQKLALCVETLKGNFKS